MYGLLVCGVSLLFVMPAFAADYSVGDFQKASLTLAAGASESSVHAALGMPGAVEPEGAGEVKALKATKGLVYWHPEWATAHLLVGIRSGKVTGVRMCKIEGSRVSTVKCQSSASFWREASD
jgi:hypothetical protein